MALLSVACQSVRGMWSASPVRVVGEGSQLCPEASFSCLMGGGLGNSGVLYQVREMRSWQGQNTEGMEPGVATIPWGILICLALSCLPPLLL